MQSAHPAPAGSNRTRTALCNAFVAAAGGLVLLSGCAMHITATPAAPAAPAVPAAVSAPADPAKLAGRWTVDLRSGPGESAYTQPFVVDSVDAAKRSIAGNFYNSTISWSRINTAWGKVVVTFVTSDGQGDYVHTATLEGDKLVGTSSARHRNMLVPWTATREQK